MYSSMVAYLALAVLTLYESVFDFILAEEFHRTVGAVVTALSSVMWVTIAVLTLLNYLLHEE